jgi:hypothetical protein
MQTDTSQDRETTDLVSTPAEPTSLAELLADHQKWHSEYQIDHFILGRCSTPFGAYKQCVRSLHARARSLKVELIEHEKAELDLGDLEEKYLEVTERESRRVELDIELKKLELAQRSWALTHRRRELRRFWAHAIYLKKIVGDLTDDRRAGLERAYWIEHVQKLLVLDMFRNNQPSSGTIEILTSMPHQDRREVMAILGKGMDLNAMATVVSDKQLLLMKALPDDFEDSCKRLELEISESEIDERIGECPQLRLTS